MAKKAKSKKPEYSGAPNKISESVWFYTTKKGLLFVAEAREPDGYLLKSVQFTVPWRKVVAVAEIHKTVRAQA